MSPTLTLAIERPPNTIRIAVPGPNATNITDSRNRKVDGTGATSDTHSAADVAMATTSAQPKGGSCVQPVTSRADDADLRGRIEPNGE
jgi:hypothetical protein